MIWPRCTMIFLTIFGVFPLFYLAPDTISSKPIVEEISKFIVSVIAITLPTYFAAITLFFNTTETKLEKISAILHSVNSPYYNMSILILPYIRKGYYFSISVMSLSLVWSSCIYLVTMLFGDMFSQQPKLYFFVGIFLFLCSVISSLCSLMQIVGLMKLCDEDGQGIIKLSCTYEEILKRIDCHKEKNEDFKV